jgi:6-pyruvoyltetrahydropterin/6-carboxytetrahydropterin synthase
MPSYEIRVAKGDFVFSSAHFITYEGHKCETLHGHNYRAKAALQGDLGPNSYVVDFSFIKPIIRSIVDELDHRVLLPQENPLISISNEDGHVRAQYRDRKYVFPQKDVVLLPIANTTAELLAGYILSRLAETLRERAPDLQLQSAEVEVDESFGQSGVCRMDAEDLSALSGGELSRQSSSNGHPEKRQSR